MRIRSSKPTQPTLKGIAARLDGTFETVVSLIVSVRDELRGEIGDIRDRVGSLKGEMSDLRETVEFIKDHAATKDELLALDGKIDQVKRDLQQELQNELSQTRASLRAEIRETRNEMIAHVDGFIQLHKIQEAELAAVNNRLTRHESSAHP